MIISHVTATHAPKRVGRSAKMVAVQLFVNSRKLLALGQRIQRLSPLVVCKRQNSYESVLRGQTVRIGCSSGFWGDTMVSAPQLIHSGNIDFLVSDYLSEITMSLLTAMKKKTNGAGGFAPDFVQVAMAPYVRDIKKKGIKVISNAGGVNPMACAAALKSVCDSASVDLNIAVVTGDDLMPHLSELKNQGIQEMQNKSSLPDTVNSMNAYLGAGSIARALDLGADVVITGRCVDSALVLGPLIHKFKWKMDDFDILSQGSLAGHLIECGAQVTGGIFTDWHKVPDWSNIGFPIVECAADGNFVVTKPPKTGGLVSVATVSEQLLYEVGDPGHYYLPDVTCDFSHVHLHQLTEHDREAVHVTGAKGLPPSKQYKVSATYADGYRLTAVAVVGGPRSKDKAERTADEIIKRCRRIFKQLKLDDFTRLHREILGSEHNYGPMSQIPHGAREAVLWMAAHHKDKKALEILSREIAPSGTGMAPGLTGIVGGRPKVSPVLKLYSFLYNKDKLPVDIHLNGEYVETYKQPDIPALDYVETSPPVHSEEEIILKNGPNAYRLEDLAYTRSGDKGNSANIAVIARHPNLLPYIRRSLTEEAVKEYFHHLLDNQPGPTGKQVQRYDVPGLGAVNFMLYNSLGGGGIASLRSDPQGKAYGQMLLDFEITNMPDIHTLIT